MTDYINRTHFRGGSVRFDDLAGMPENANGVRQVTKGCPSVKVFGVRYDDDGEQAFLALLNKFNSCPAHALEKSKLKVHAKNQFNKSTFQATGISSPENAHPISPRNTVTEFQNSVKFIYKKLVSIKKTEGILYDFCQLSDH